MTQHTYVLTVADGLTGVERLIGLLRRRRVRVTRFALEGGEADGAPSRAWLSIASSNHPQVVRQLARLIDVSFEPDVGPVPADQVRGVERPVWITPCSTPGWIEETGPLHLTNVGGSHDNAA